ncbi:MAG: hypothetical protein NZM42_01695 [Gemmatales bacterium]|nr:hypothetical protein [Gemmatales bacterium]MDW8221412.1 hypothetical protein [Gemmatales bacterium]
MKIAQRKEPATNYLADQFGKLANWQNPHLVVWLAALLVGVLVLLAYWAVPRQARERMTYSWRELWDSENRSFPVILETPEFSASSLQELADRNKGTPVYVPALFLQARAKQALALRHVDNLELAWQHLEQAERFYKQVLAAGGLAVEMRLRAHLGLAQIAETRYWLEAGRLESQTRKQRWSELLERYNQLLRLAQRDLAAPSNEAHPLVREIEAHVQRLKDPQTEDLVFLQPPSVPSASGGTPTVPDQPSDPSKVNPE